MMFPSFLSDFIRSEIRHPAASVSRFNYTILDADEKTHHCPSCIGFFRFRALPRTILPRCGYAHGRIGCDEKIWGGCTER